MTTKTEKKPAPKKPAKQKPPADKKPSALDAAAQILATAKESISCRELIAAMAAKKLWTSPGGKTPHATLYSTITREISTKDEASRFAKVDRGRFAAGPGCER